MKSPTDEEILGRVQHGERNAYIVLFDRYYPRIERYALRLLQDSEAARDAASETFVRAYRSVDGFRTGEIGYAAYLFLICKRLIINDQARLTPRNTQWLADLGEDDFQPAPADEVPLAILLRAERDAMIQSALNCLAPDDREIIHLAFERDLSRKDIAEIMGKPSVTAVTTHLYRAMKRLRIIVLQQGYFATELEWERNYGDRQRARA